MNVMSVIRAGRVGQGQCVPAISCKQLDDPAPVFAGRGTPMCELPLRVQPGRAAGLPVSRTIWFVAGSQHRWRATCGVFARHSRGAPSAALTAGRLKLRLKSCTQVGAAGSSRGSSREGPRAALMSAGDRAAPAGQCGDVRLFRPCRSCARLLYVADKSKPSSAADTDAFTRSRRPHRRSAARTLRPMTRPLQDRPVPPQHHQERAEIPQPTRRQAEDRAADAAAGAAAAALGWQAPGSKRVRPLRCTEETHVA